MIKEIFDKCEKFTHLLEEHPAAKKEELRVWLDEYNELMSSLDKAKTDCEHVLFISDSTNETSYFNAAVNCLTKIMQTRSCVKSVHQKIYRMYSGKGIQIEGPLTYKVRVCTEVFGKQVYIGRDGSLITLFDKGSGMMQEA